MSLGSKRIKPAGSGRAKGVLNKRSVEIEDKIKSLGMDPLENLSKLIPQLDLNQQAHIYIAIMPYVYARRRAIDLSPEDLERLAQMKMLEKMSKEELDKFMTDAKKNEKSVIDISSLP